MSEPNNTNSDTRTDEMKRTMAEHFNAFEYEYREDDDTGAEVVCEDDQVAIVADHTGHELNEWADEFGVDRNELSQTFHELARQVCDYSWEVSDPIVFDKLE